MLASFLARVATPCGLFAWLDVGRRLGLVRRSQPADRHAGGLESGCRGRLTPGAQARPAAMLRADRTRHRRSGPFQQVLTRQGVRERGPVEEGLVQAVALAASEGEKRLIGLHLLRAERTGGEMAGLGGRWRFIRERGKAFRGEVVTMLASAGPTSVLSMCALHCCLLARAFPGPKRAYWLSWASTHLELAGLRTGAARHVLRERIPAVAAADPIGAVARTREMGQHPPHPHACLERLGLRSTRGNAQRSGDLLMCVALDVVQHEHCARTRRETGRRLSDRGSHEWLLVVRGCRRAVLFDRSFHEVHPS